MTYDELVAEVRDLRDAMRALQSRVDELEQKTEPDDDTCWTCGCELPLLGEPGHNVRFEAGVEAHYCDEHA